MSSFSKLDSRLLIEAYLEAIHLKLNEEFLMQLLSEIKSRNIKLFIIKEHQHGTTLI